ncbi:MAG: DUF3524 domain-containing protein [Saprospiraceae bacterium]
MLIYLFNPFHTGSHQRWAEEYVAHSGHTVRCFSLPGRHWKWRMHGAAVRMAQMLLSQTERPDLILTTDMMDVATFKALTARVTATIPVVVYFHENQLTYPWSPTDEDVPLQRDRHYAWLNYTSALAADACFFNSHYHQEDFMAALVGFLKAFPDEQPFDTIDAIRAKSRVVHLGMELPPVSSIIEKQPAERPVLLWNHRWEFDKNPASFFRFASSYRKLGMILGWWYWERIMPKPRPFSVKRTINFNATYCIGAMPRIGRITCIGCNVHT